MIRIVFIGVGLILMVVGLIVSQSGGAVVIQHQVADPQTSQLAKNIVGLFLGGLGGVFLIIGLIGWIRDRQRMKRLLYIAENGVQTEATVTFADKNYSFTVNNKPVFSIVEYSFLDQNGQQFTRKVTNLNSDLVIRKQIQVGSKIQVKYLPENPAESVILL